MTSYLRAYCDRAAAEQGQPGTPIRFVASTEGVKRDGKNLRAADWRFDNFRGNPVVLWAHDYMGHNLPIGRAEPSIEDACVMTDVTFDQADDFARSVESKYRRGFLHAVSVGWNDVTEGGRAYHDLMDVSAVPVPADPQALKVQSVRALRNVLDELDQMAYEAEGGNRTHSVPDNQRDPAGMTTIGNWIEAGIHGDFTDRCDFLFSAGFIDRDERIALSNGIGDALGVLAKAIDGTNDLRTRELELCRAAVFPDRRAASKRAAIPPHTMAKAANDAVWDGPAEIEECPAEEASLRRTFAWVNSDADPSLKSSYKLPHHEAGGNVVWRGVATAMARLLQAGTDIPDADRKGVYAHLERHYKQFDKTAPEFRNVAELAALGAEEIRGQFLEGEEEFLPARPDFEFRSAVYNPTSGELVAIRGICADGKEYQFDANAGARVGAMLNARNRGDLEQAVSLVQGVLERAKTESGNEGNGGNSNDGRTQTSEPDPATARNAEALANVLAQLKQTQIRLGGQNA